MYIYNTTYLVVKEVYSEWFSWVKSTHIPSMQKMGFSNPQVSKVLITDPEQKEFSMSVQFKIDTLEALNRWSESRLQEIRNDIHKQFGEKVLPFDTVLEIIETND